ncbi:uncharacterized protein LOC135691716 [Rhopilema esculentum]|uniref:uncharacterized protein LOC135691716 n=1 Tax=Rhopilema esculentum TaxID=499914 RepID=UPI0031CED182
MHSHVDSSFLLPEMMTENSRFSTPRSSVGDGISTDCDADVESNMSGNSEETSPHRRRSSYGIYGIVPANRSTILGKQSERLKKESEHEEEDMSWKSIAMQHKLVLLCTVAFITLMVFSILFTFAVCQSECKKENMQELNKSDLKSKWPLLLENHYPQTKMLLSDINGDGENDIVAAFRQNASVVTDVGSIEDGNKSVIKALDGKTGLLLKEIAIDFLPFWIYVDDKVKANTSCFVLSRYGEVAKVMIATETIVWSVQPCSEVHSVLLTKDLDFDSNSDLLVVCSWVSATDTTISGIALISSTSGSLIGSKIRYQLGQTPSPFLMQHINKKNETCILFGTERHGKSTVLAVRLKRLIEIATGTRSKVNLVSENPLVVAKNVRTDVQAAYEDISGDGVKDIGFVLQHGMISFIDGATLTLKKTIDARHGRIIRISVLSATSFNRPRLAVLKSGKDRCSSATLNVYDFKNAFNPYAIEIPFNPLLVSESYLNGREAFIFWISSQLHASCASESPMPSRNITEKTYSKKEFNSKVASHMMTQTEESGIDDIADDIDIDAIDRDVLDNLREYVGIDDKGVTRHHKLFHLVCNYLLLRFLISYGITTDSVLKDFRSTRNHLLNLSNRNLGRALTDQLKGLLAADYDKDVDIPPWFDDVENDIDWLKDAGMKRSVKSKRDIQGIVDGEGDWNIGNKLSFEELDGKELEEEDLKESLTVSEPLKKIPSKEETERKQWTTDIKSLFRDKVKDISHLSEARKVSHNDMRQPSNRNGLKETFEETLNSEPCHLPVPRFKSLEIIKTKFKWRNITVLTEDGASDKKYDNTAAKEKRLSRNVCSGIQMQVQDMLVDSNHMYYMLVYYGGSLQDNVLTQINSVRLNNFE